MKKSYVIDWTAKTVTVTKKFMEEAGVIGTTAFEQRRILAEMGLTFQIREVKPRRNGKITYKQMMEYITRVEDSAHYLTLFESVRGEAKSKNNPYNRVLDWFKATFPRFYDAPEFNDRNEIIVKPHDYPATDTVVELVPMDA